MPDDDLVQKGEGKYVEDASFDEWDSIITRVIATRASYERGLEDYRRKMQADASNYGPPQKFCYTNHSSSAA